MIPIAAPRVAATMAAAVNWGEAARMQGDASQYLVRVQEEFKDEPDKFNEFLDVLKHFRSRTVDVPHVIERVTTLFAGRSAAGAADCRAEIFFFLLAYIGRDRTHADLWTKQKRARSFSFSKQKCVCPEPVLANR